MSRMYSLTVRDGILYPCTLRLCRPSSTASWESGGIPSWDEAMCAGDVFVLKCFVYVS